MKAKHILISDPTLRDGNHAVQHQLTKEQVALYCKAADEAGVPIVEVGHGNGLGASSLQVGLSLETDYELITTARKNLHKSKLAIHVIPGFATIKRDLENALSWGVDIVRVASHCTEADITQRHISFTRDKGKTAYGVLMMSHMAEVNVLVEEAFKMQSYGAEAIIIMDSAGAFLPDDVSKRISALSDALNIPVGFHAHNNLGMAIANSLAAIESGALILDGTARGFGAGAGNTQLEVLIAVLHKLGYTTGIDLYKMLDAADIVENSILKTLPYISSVSVVSGLAGVFSGFAKHVERIAVEYEIDPKTLFFNLGLRKVVAGQEDIIIEEAQKLKSKKNVR
ncbi:MAG TPA: 4-hydroxy-2-oxovalerate aldolase [Ferruginibacter sp.]|nr:4-hydroxy-2-oxovalerate aldolase [Ferruginibacter sp.]